MPSLLGGSKSTTLAQAMAIVAIAAVVSLTGCASTPKKNATPQYAVPRPPQTQKEQPKSGIASWFQPAEKPKPRDVPSWMDSTTRVDP
ncbi:MAG: hypothetical protein LLG00_07100 [Planctomycetaceae bacterium]|nr:hypothetical protein [Planctomycetaceae bacterium]